MRVFLVKYQDRMSSESPGRITPFQAVFPETARQGEFPIAGYKVLSARHNEASMHAAIRQETQQPRTP